MAKELQASTISERKLNPILRVRLEGGDPLSSNRQLPFHPHRLWLPQARSMRTDMDPHQVQDE